MNLIDKINLYMRNKRIDANILKQKILIDTMYEMLVGSFYEEYAKSTDEELSKITGRLVVNSKHINYCLLRDLNERAALDNAYIILDGSDTLLFRVKSNDITKVFKRGC